MKQAEKLLKEKGYVEYPFDNKAFHEVLEAFFLDKAHKANAVLRIREMFFGDFSIPIREKGFLYDFDGKSAHEVFRMKDRATVLWFHETKPWTTEEERQERLEERRQKLCAEFGEDIVAKGCLYDGISSQLFDMAVDGQYACTAVGLLRSMGFNVRKRKKKIGGKDVNWWSVSLLSC